MYNVQFYDDKNNQLLSATTTQSAVNLHKTVSKEPQRHFKHNGLLVFHRDTFSSEYIVHL